MKSSESQGDRPALQGGAGSRVATLGFGANCAAGNVLLVPSATASVALAVH